MTKEELEKQKWNDIFLEDCAVYDKKIAEEYTTLEEQIAKLKEENKELKEVHESDKRSLRLIAEKGAELEKKISILLSCKNCPNNKGGLLCQKEYEGKCLSQKTQYIKELKEEIAELKDKLKNLESVAEVRLANWQKYEAENEGLKKKIENLQKYLDTQNCYRECAETWEKLTEAKELIETMYIYQEGFSNMGELKQRAREFLKKAVVDS